MIKVTMILTVLLASVLYADIPTTSAPNERGFMKELDDIKAATEAGQADAVATQLCALAEKLKTSEVSPATYSQTVEVALRTVIWSRVGANDKLRDIAAQIGIDVVGTKTKGITDPDVLQRRLEIALDILPRTTAAAEKIAILSLQLWADMLAASEHYSMYDSANPKVKFEMPTPPPGYAGPFRSGMDPAAITDPQFRKQYAEFLKKRDEFNQNSSKYRHICDMKEHFLPKLKDALKAAYSGDPDREKVGSALIEKAVSDKTMRAELLKAVQSAPATQPATKSAD